MVGVAPCSWPRAGQPGERLWRGRAPLRRLSRPADQPAVAEKASDRFGMRTKSAQQRAGAARQPGAQASALAVRVQQRRHPAARHSQSIALPSSQPAPARAPTQPGHPPPTTALPSRPSSQGSQPARAGTHPPTQPGHPPTHPPTRVPGVHQLHSQARRRVAQRQHKAQRADGQVQAAPLHRYDIHLLRRHAGAGAQGVMSAAPLSERQRRQERRCAGQRGARSAAPGNTLQQRRPRTRKEGWASSASAMAAAASSLWPSGS